MKRSSVFLLMLGVAAVALVAGYMLHPNVVSPNSAKPWEQFKSNTAHTQLDLEPVESLESITGKRILNADLIESPDILKGLKKLRFDRDFSPELYPYFDTNALQTKCELMIRQNGIQLVSSNEDADLNFLVDGFTNAYGVVYETRLRLHMTGFFPQRTNYVMFEAECYRSGYFGVAPFAKAESYIIESQTKTFEQFLNDYLKANQ